MITRENSMVPKCSSEYNVNISPEIQYMIAVNLMMDFSIMTSDMNKLLDL